LAAAMSTQLRYKSHEMEIVQVVPGGFYCKWDSGETYTMPTTEVALFLAEKFIDGIYGEKQTLEYWSFTK
jgi:hypothetical protein